MKLNARELGTVLAALRYFQANKDDAIEALGNEYFTASGEVERVEGIEPLTAGEIDTLCENLNLGDNETVKIVWTAEDIWTLKPKWSLEKCDKWLMENRKAIQDRSIELGWEVIETLLL